MVQQVLDALYGFIVIFLDKVFFFSLKNFLRFTDRAVIIVCYHYRNFTNKSFNL